MSTAKGRRHMGRVAQLPCMLCQHIGLGDNYTVEVHHIREEQGAGQRADDMLTIPLCAEHHRGPSGTHGLGKRGFYTRYKVTELDLLAKTLEALEP